MVFSISEEEDFIVLFDSIEQQILVAKIIGTLDNFFSYSDFNFDFKHMKDFNLNDISNINNHVIKGFNFIKKEIEVQIDSFR
jgi:hypothetical protein